MPLPGEHPYIKLYDECLKKAEQIFVERNNQYNNEVDIREYWTFGFQSIIHELAKKVFRMKSLLKAGKGSMTLGLEDSLLDIINYCCFLYAEIQLSENEKEKQKSDSEKV